MLPITPASTYLGADPAYVRSLVEVLPVEVKAYRARGPDFTVTADTPMYALFKDTTLVPALTSRTTRAASPCG
jgi:hypothetical protein